MIKQLFHGSTEIITSPQYGKGKPYNDYGLGFYCTENSEMAKEWAAQKDREGFSNHYQLDCTNLTILNLCTPEYTILHWLTILLENRIFEIGSPLSIEAKDYLISNFHIPYEEYDIIQGYRADDSYFSFAHDFISGGISIKQLGAAMKLGKLGEQIVLKSKKSFDCIEYIDSETVPSQIYYDRKMTRDRKAREEYLSRERYKRSKDDLFIMNIIDEEIKGDDERLR